MGFEPASAGDRDTGTAILAASPVQGNWATVIRSAQASLLPESARTAAAATAAWLRLLPLNESASQQSHQQRCAHHNGVYHCIFARCCAPHDSAYMDMWVAPGDLLGGKRYGNTKQSLPQFLFCPVPKNGLTQWEHAISLAANSTDNPGYNQACCSGPDQKFAWLQGGVPLAVVVRSPFDRYVSAFNEFMLWHRGWLHLPLEQRFHKFVTQYLLPTRELSAACEKSNHGKGPLMHKCAASQHWRSQAMFCGLWLGVPMTHVWKFEEFPYLSPDKTLRTLRSTTTESLGPPPQPNNQGHTPSEKEWYATGFGQHRNLSFPASMQAINFGAILPAKGKMHWHMHPNISKLWTYDLVLSVLCARRLEMVLLWPLYGRDILETAASFDLLLDAATWNANAALAHAQLCNYTGKHHVGNA